MTDQTAAPHYVVLIPSYKPDERLVELARTLLGHSLRVWVVDDGSGPEYAGFFQQCVALGARLESYPENHGKGYALKTGLGAMKGLDEDIRGVVTADADGQHTPADILRLVAAMQASPDALVLGVRAFVGDVPFKSRAGNAITRVVYRMATGISISDTQTGLRGIPAKSIPDMCKIEGDRYEYEMNMLLKVRDLHLQVVQVPIETIYINENAGSHFKPLRDATRIYYTILRFTLASMVCGAVDLLLYWLFLRFFPVQASYIMARIVSSLMNFLLNKKTVFKTRGGNRRSLLRYYILVIVQMLIGSGVTALLSRSAFDPRFIKIPVDLVLFVVNYHIQRNWVFKKKEDSQEEGDE